MMHEYGGRNSLGREPAALVMTPYVFHAPARAGSVQPKLYLDSRRSRDERAIGSCRHVVSLRDTSKRPVSAAGESGCTGPRRLRDGPLVQPDALPGERIRGAARSDARRVSLAQA